jgi:hypothetical protein
VDLSGAHAAVGSSAASRLPRPQRWWSKTLLFPAAVLAVHQLRYLIAFGSHAGSALSARGDRYVATAAVVAATLLVISLGVGLARLVVAWRGRGDLDFAQAPWWLVWLGLTVLLLAGFCALEGLEVALEPHHTGGLVGIFADGGLWALPAAAFVGAVMTLLGHGGRALLVIAARRRITRRASVSAPRHRGASRCAPRRRPMASCAAGRAPPLIELP